MTEEQQIQREIDRITQDFTIKLKACNDRLAELNALRAKSKTENAYYVKVMKDLSMVNKRIDIIGSCPEWTRQREKLQGLLQNFRA